MKAVLSRLDYLLGFSFTAILAAPAYAGSYPITEIAPPSDLYPNPAYIRARAINANGQVTGSYSPNFSGWVQRGFLYSAGITTDIGTLGGRTEGLAINSAGHITGWSEISATLPANRHAFLYKDGNMTDLHGPGVLASDSTGIGINDSG
jgi:probable HAF family extracellular repeat protein